MSYHVCPKCNNTDIRRTQLNGWQELNYCNLCGWEAVIDTKLTKEDHHGFVV